jgi:hypothetical protein
MRDSFKDSQDLLERVEELFGGKAVLVGLEIGEE